MSDDPGVRLTMTDSKLVPIVQGPTTSPDAALAGRAWCVTCGHELERA